MADVGRSAMLGRLVTVTLETSGEDVPLQMLPLGALLRLYANWNVVGAFVVVGAEVDVLADVVLGVLVVVVVGGDGVGISTSSTQKTLSFASNKVTLLTYPNSILVVRPSIRQYYKS